MQMAGTTWQEDTTTLTTTYGPFSFDGVSVRSPADYLAARGNALLDAILADQDDGYNPGGYPDEEMAVLGRLDDDYQVWRVTVDPKTGLAPPGVR